MTNMPICSTTNKNNDVSNVVNSNNVTNVNNNNDVTNVNTFNNDDEDSGVNLTKILTCRSVNNHSKIMHGK